MSDGWATGGDWRTCVMCGAMSDDRLDVSWSVWPEDGIWVDGPRCRDHDACRRRIESRVATDATPETDATDESAEPEWTFG